MYTIAVCDRDKKAYQSLRNALGKILDTLGVLHIIKQYEDSQSLYNILRKYPEKYNLLFLETELEPFRGIELAEKLREKGYRGSIAFITHNREDVFRAYDVDACQYFLKPVSAKKLKALLLKLSLRDLQKTRQYLILNYNVNYYRIPHEDITYIETMGRKVAIHTKNETVTYPCKLSELAQALPSHQFIRCHQSFIVQTGAVAQISGSRICLADGTEIPISRTYRDMVREAFSIN